MVISALEKIKSRKGNKECRNRGGVEKGGLCFFSSTAWVCRRSPMSEDQKEGNERSKQIFGERLEYHERVLTLRILLRGDDSDVFISDDWPSTERMERRV